MSRRVTQKTKECPPVKEPAHTQSPHVHATAWRCIPSIFSDSASPKRAQPSRVSESINFRHPGERKFGAVTLESIDSDAMWSLSVRIGGPRRKLKFQRTTECYRLVQKMFTRDKLTFRTGFPCVYFWPVLDPEFPGKWLLVHFEAQELSYPIMMFPSHFWKVQNLEMSVPGAPIFETKRLSEAVSNPSKI